MNRYVPLMVLLFLAGLLAGCTENVNHLHVDGTEHSHKEGNIEHQHIALEEKIILDDTPRISYWAGKVNNYYENGTWNSDPDDTSGANIDMLEYCKKWWGNSVDVKLRPLQEIISFKISGESTQYLEERPVYECVLEINDTTSRISYWPGMVNQYADNGTWTSDPDGISGANIDFLEYCKKWWPNTISVKKQQQSELITFHSIEDNNTTKISSEVYQCRDVKSNAQAADYSSSLLKASTVIVQVNASEIIILTSFVWILFTLFMVAGKFEYRNYQANKMIDRVVFEEE